MCVFFYVYVLCVSVHVYILWVFFRVVLLSVSVLFVVGINCLWIHRLSSVVNAWIAPLAHTITPRAKPVSLATWEPTRMRWARSPARLVPSEQVARAWRRSPDPDRPRTARSVVLLDGTSTSRWASAAPVATGISNPTKASSLASDATAASPLAPRRPCRHLSAARNANRVCSWEPPARASHARGAPTAPRAFTPLASAAQRTARPKGPVLRHWRSVLSPSVLLAPSCRTLSACHAPRATTSPKPSRRFAWAARKTPPRVMLAPRPKTSAPIRARSTGNRCCAIPTRSASSYQKRVTLSVAANLDSTELANIALVRDLFFFFYWCTF